MDLKNCSTAIFVRDINTSKKFYCDVPGLPVEQVSERTSVPVEEIKKLLNIF